MVFPLRDYVMIFSGGKAGNARKTGRFSSTVLWKKHAERASLKKEKPFLCMKDHDGSALRLSE